MSTHSTKDEEFNEFRQRQQARLAELKAMIAAAEAKASVEAHSSN